MSGLATHQWPMSELLPEPVNSALIQLIVFVDERSRSTAQYQEVVAYLNSAPQARIQLKIIDVGEQPDLAEYFKLVATPTLVKLYPLPRQTFTGSSLLRELQNWLPAWMEEIAEVDATGMPNATGDLPSNLNQISDFLKLADEIFYLRQQQSALQEQLRFKEQVINILAHDLRNPLTATSLTLDTISIAQNPQDLRSAKLQPEMVQKLIIRAKEQLHRADRLISDILQLSQGAVADITISPHTHRVEDLLQDVLQQLGEQLGAKQQKVITDIPQDLPAVYADAARIKQVLVNLLENAVKYTPIGSCIRVAALHRTSQKVQISIMDNGPGIPENEYDLVFQKNYRLQRSQQEEGYGLGLPLCRSIILAHYGQIWVESSEKGSTFHFTLLIYP
jgi:two-component system, OmpR family, clock-associated histidine kinase SasA